MHTMFTSIILFVSVVFLTNLAQSNKLKVPVSTKRSFSIDYERNTFLLDGKPFRYISGTIHYFQVPRKFWRDRLTKLRAGGCNAVETYLAWNWHEPYKGHYKFSGDQDMLHFLDVAHDLGLYVILRLGPYMDAEQDMGGFPAWLLKYKNIGLRQSDPRYMKEVAAWYDKVLPMIQPKLYPNGGSVIMAQVENEYGSYYACDRNYTKWLYNLVRTNFGTDKIVYFTTDGDAESYLKCGVINGTYPTVDFGTAKFSDVTAGFAAQRKYAPKGPLVNSEFYPGWFDEWGQRHSRVDIGAVLDTMTYMYDMNASFNIYPFLGGTNWGYQAGAEAFPDGFGTITTSYDFDAPLTEAGDLTPKWFAIRQHIERLTGVPNKWPIPSNTEKMWYGNVQFTFFDTIFDLLPHLIDGRSVRNVDYPLTMEQLDHYYGLTLYETTIRNQGGYMLNLTGVHDRGYVFINRSQLAAVVQRPHVANGTAVMLQVGDKLSILVENQGRICYGTFINDTKGLVANVTLDGRVLRKWTIYPLHLERAAKHAHRLMHSTSHRQQQRAIDSHENGGFIPKFYTTVFEAAPHAGETFLDMTDWGRGFAFTDNGYNLGRYWATKGPQQTLYHPFVKHGRNRVTIFEMERARGASPGTAAPRRARLINYPILG